MSATVVFRLQDQFYGVHIDHVREIVPIMRVTQVPQMPHDWYGIANIRTHVTPIINLRKHLGLPYLEPNLTTPIIILQEDGRQLGILVDEIARILYNAGHASVDYQEGMMIINLEISAIFVKTPDIAERSSG